MELSPWAHHPKDQLSLSYRDQPNEKPISMRGKGEETPSVV